MAKKKFVSATAETNPDLLTGEPGSHPVGTGVGAASAGAAGAAIGAVAGPIGAVVGAVAGAVAGGYAGKAAAEAIDPTAEDAYWSENYRSRSYVEQDADYDVYRPAYRYGWESRSRYSDRPFDEVEPELQKNWGTDKGHSKLAWEKARMAARDAWDRVDRTPDRDTLRKPK